MIRDATPDDVAAIHDMIVGLAEFEMEPDAVTATPADLHEALFGPRPALFAHVADDAEHGVVGFSLWFLNYSTWLGRHGIYLEDLFVQPEHRGSGYGRALLANLARICVERGYGRWVVERKSEPGFIGFCGLKLATFDAPFLPANEIGYRFLPEFWKLGFATEAGHVAA